MGRGRAHEAEVAGRGHQPLAEVLLPHAVHHDACRERIAIARDPLRQTQPTPGARCFGTRKRWLFLDQDGRHCGCHQITLTCR